MIFPKGRAVHENLNTSFTNFDAMLADLKANLFTGYVRITSWEYEGILLLDTGNAVHALDETKGERRSGPVAAETLAAKAREKDGAISVYRLPDETVQILVGLANGEAMYRDLSSEFTSLDKLVAKLQAEKHTGYVEIQVRGDSTGGVIFLQDGRTVEAVLSSNGDVISGDDAVARIIKESSTHSSLFTVYKTDLAKAYNQGSDLAGNVGRDQLFAFWGEVLGTLEARINAATKPAAFIVAFRRTSIALADRYPFLDPFAAEFEFKDGAIRYDAQAPLNELSQGLSQVAAQTVRTLMAEFKNLDRVLQPELSGLKAKYGSMFADVGLEAALGNLLGS